MPSRTVTTDIERDQASVWLANLKPPFSVSVTMGRDRSVDQNRLSHAWYRDIAQQRGDMTEAEVRAECKLIFGVPILRRDNEEFRTVYDRHLKPRTYEEKCDFIRTMELPITRLMSVSQFNEYLSAMEDHFRKQGIVLAA